MSNYYNINWYTLGYDWLLISLRKPGLMAFVKSVLRPMELLHLDFLNFRADCLYKVQHTSQVCYLEAMLNDKFDPLHRRIRIVNTEFKDPIFFYEPLENKDVFFYEPEDNQDLYFREQSEIVGDGVDFSVCIPPALQPGTETGLLAFETKVNAQINYYKLYSKNHQIKWVLVSN